MSQNQKGIPWQTGLQILFQRITTTAWNARLSYREHNITHQKNPFIIYGWFGILEKTVIELELQDLSGLTWNADESAYPSEPKKFRGVWTWSTDPANSDQKWSRKENYFGCCHCKRWIVKTPDNFPRTKCSDNIDTRSKYTILPLPLCKWFRLDQSLHFL